METQIVLLRLESSVSLVSIITGNTNNLCTALMIHMFFAGMYIQVRLLSCRKVFASLPDGFFF